MEAPRDLPKHDSFDLDELRARLVPWFSEHLDADEVELGRVTTPDKSGFSSETLLVDVAWSIEGDEHRAGFVVKSQPSGDLVFPTYDLPMQFDVMRRVREHAGLPAAPVRWQDPDGTVTGRPSYVMDRVDGRVPQDNLPYTIEGWVLEELTPQQRHEMILGSLDVLGGLHAIDVGAAGLGFLDRPAFGEPGLPQLLGEWTEYFDFASPGVDHEIGRAALSRLRDTLPTSPPPTGLVWGDSRIGNLMYAPDGTDVVAILDWEMAALGPGECDLAWFLHMHRFFTRGLGVADPEGWPTEDEQIARWEAAAGRSVDDLDWYLLFAAYRYAMIMVRIILNQRAAGNEPLWGPDDNLAVAILASYL